QLPVVAPTHGAIDFDYRVGYFGDPVGGVPESARHRFPQKRAYPVLTPDESLDALGQVFNVLRHIERRQFHFLSWPIIERGLVYRPDFPLTALPGLPAVKATLCLVTENPLSDHCAQKFGGSKNLALFIFGQRLVKVLDDVTTDVE